MESERTTDATDARRALEDVEESRRSIARRVVAPWWYRWGTPLCTAGLFVGAGITISAGEEPGMLGFLVTVSLAILAPLALLVALQRATGVSVDRYASGWGAWYAVVLSLFGVAVAVQVVADVPFVLPAAGVVAFVMTLVTEQRTDAQLRERVETGTTVA